MEDNVLIDKLLNNEHIDLLSNNVHECFSDGINSLLLQEDVSELMINGLNSVYVEKNGVLSLCDIKVTNNEIQKFIDAVCRLNSRNVDLNHPIFDGRLPGGFRCNIVAPPVSLCGFIITIRKHSTRITSISELVSLSMLNKDDSELLLQGVQDKKNIMISGGTGTGKTTLVNVLFNSLLSYGSQRVITIEDTAELKISLPHVVNLEARYATPDCPVEIGIRDLVHTALRMRPDRLVIGEVRGEEAYDFLHALNTGHKGTICTIHANSCRDALRRLETLAVLGHPNLDILVPRSWIASNIDIVAHVERVNGVRKLKELKKIEGVEAENYVLCDLMH